MSYRLPPSAYGRGDEYRSSGPAGHVAQEEPDALVPYDPSRVEEWRRHVRETESNTSWAGQSSQPDFGWGYQHSESTASDTYTHGALGTPTTSHHQRISQQLPMSPASNWEEETFWEERDENNDGAFSSSKRHSSQEEIPPGYSVRITREFVHPTDENGQWQSIPTAASVTTRQLPSGREVEVTLRTFRTAVQTRTQSGPGLPYTCTTGDQDWDALRLRIWRKLHMYYTFTSIDEVTKAFTYQNAVNLVWTHTGRDPTQYLG